MDKPLVSNLESSHDWRIYVQKLKEWNKNKQLAEDNQIRFTSLFKTMQQFKKFSWLTKVITTPNNMTGPDFCFIYEFITY